MDTAKFSSIDVGAYAIDGMFLVQLSERLCDLASRHGARMIELTVDIEVPNGPYGRVERRHRDTSPLLDGSFGRDPAKVGIMVHGHAPCGDGHQPYVLSLTLEPARGGFMMATGPALLAQEGFDTIRGAMAAAERFADIPREQEKLPATIVQAMDHQRKALRLHEAIDVARVAFPGLIALAVYAWGFFGPRRDTAFCMALGVAFVFFALAQYWGIGPRRRARLERATRDAEAAGIPKPAPKEKPLRTIDLSRPEGDDMAARLAYDPLVPLEV